MKLIAFQFEVENGEIVSVLPKMRDSNKNTLICRRMSLLTEKQTSLYMEVSEAVQNRFPGVLYGDIR